MPILNIFSKFVRASKLGSQNQKPTQKRVHQLALETLEDRATPSVAVPTVTVTDPSGAFTGKPFTAHGAVTGVHGANLGTPTFTYYKGVLPLGKGTQIAPTDPGLYTVVATFAGNSQYASASAETTLVITKAMPTISVTDPSGVYTGNAYIAQGSVKGVAGANLGTPTFTYYLGSTPTGKPLSGAPTNAGNYTVVASYHGTRDYSRSSAMTRFVISRAKPAVTVFDSSGSYTRKPFTAHGAVTGVHGANLGTPTFTYYAGASVHGTPLSGAPTNTGTYTVVASYNGSDDYGPASAQMTFTIGKAVPTIGVTDKGGVYNTTPYGATGSVTGLHNSNLATPTFTYYAGTFTKLSDLMGQMPLNAPPINAGKYTVTASFAGNANYSSGAALANFTITKAATVITVTDTGGVFDGTGFGATGTVSGLDNFNLGAPTFTYYAGTFTKLSGLLGVPALSGVPTAAGAYTVVASFSGNIDYSSGAALANFSITTATPTVRVTDNGGVFNGSPYSATGSVTGLKSVNLGTPTFTYYAGTFTKLSDLTGQTALHGAPTDAGHYTVVALYAGSTDYSSGAALANFSITQATPAITVGDAGGVFNGSSFGATGTVTGVNNTSLGTPTFTYYAGTFTKLSDLTGQTALSGAPTDAGNYTVVASFAGNIDYSSGAALANFSITQATPAITVGDAGGVFNGSAYSATGSVTGLNSVNLGAPTFTYYAGTFTKLSDLTGQTALSGAPTDAGNYTAVALYAGSTDYSSGAALANFSITQATPAITVSDAGGVFNGSGFGATGTVTGVNNTSLGAPTFTYYAGTFTTLAALNGQTALPGVPTEAGAYTVVASFAGNTDYSSGAALANFSITQATPTVSVTDNGGVANGSPYSATGSVIGVNNTNLGNPTFTYYAGTFANLSDLTGQTPLSGAPATAGSYTVLAAYAGSTDYTSANALANFSIT
jgi:hypothetical protein